MISREAYGERQRQRSRLRAWSLALRIGAILLWLAGLMFMIGVVKDMLWMRLWTDFVPSFLPVLFTLAVIGAVVWAISLLILSFEHIEKNTFLSALKGTENDNR